MFPRGVWGLLESQFAIPQSRRGAALEARVRGAGWQEFMD